MSLNTKYITISKCKICACMYDTYCEGRTPIDSSIILETSKGSDTVAWIRFDNSGTTNHTTLRNIGYYFGFYGSFGVNGENLDDTRMNSHIADLEEGTVIFVCEKYGKVHTQEEMEKFSTPSHSS